MNHREGYKYLGHRKTARRQLYRHRSGRPPPCRRRLLLPALLPGQAPDQVADMEDEGRTTVYLGNLDPIKTTRRLLYEIGIQARAVPRRQRVVQCCMQFIVLAFLSAI